AEIYRNLLRAGAEACGGDSLLALPCKVLRRGMTLPLRPGALLCRIGFQGVAGQGFTEGPNRARHPMAFGNHHIKRLLDPGAIALRDEERRKQLYGVACVARDLAKNPVILEQRNRYELAKQPSARRLKERPGGFEF